MKLIIFFDNWFKIEKNLPNSNIDPLGYVIPGSEVFKFKDISSVEVKNEISEANDGISAGLDNISNF